MSGKDLRLKRLFGTKKNLVISALDHVMEYGDQPGIEDARKAITNCPGTDALLLPRFMLKRNWDLFADASKGIRQRESGRAGYYFWKKYLHGSKSFKDYRCAECGNK